MLVLSRRENERIRLGDSIVVTVVRLSGDKVRLGIEAPADIVVLRDELQTLAASGPAESTLNEACSSSSCTPSPLAMARP
ncbi:MAG TPA: carbon storage regulator [Pirellulales bacterium]|nr:carbon storage regulator [Pirellulales bacterium]